MEISVTFLDNPNAQESLRIDKLLGQGKFKVFQAYSATRRTNYALKVFPDDRAGYLLYRKEKKFSKLSHPNIIQSIQATSNDSEFHVQILELAKFGDFYEVMQDRLLTNNTVLMRTYFHQLIKGVEYMHSKGVAHLDLKLENIMLGHNFQLKIIDFDGSQSLSSQNDVSRGTSGYRAPELMNGNCKDFTAADIYSMGIILYILKTGEFPFQEGKKGNMNLSSLHLKFISDKQAFWDEKCARFGPEFFSQDFIELIDGMLEYDSLQRWEIEDIKNSRWLQGTVLGENELTKIMKPKWRKAHDKKEYSQIY